MIEIFSLHKYGYFVNSRKCVTHAVAGRVATAEDLRRAIHRQSFSNAQGHIEGSPFINTLRLLNAWWSKKTFKFYGSYVCSLIV